MEQTFVMGDRSNHIFIGEFPRQDADKTQTNSVPMHHFDDSSLVSHFSDLRSLMSCHRLPCHALDQQALVGEQTNMG